MKEEPVTVKVHASMQKCACPDTWTSTITRRFLGLVTLYTSFKEGFASLTGPDTIVVARGIVAANSAEVHVCFAF